MDSPAMTGIIILLSRDINAVPPNIKLNPCHNGRGLILY
jgi:hypothetical protein